MAKKTLRPGARKQTPGLLQQWGPVALVGAIIVIALGLGLRGLNSQTTSGQTSVAAEALPQPESSQGPAGATSGPVRVADQGRAHIPVGAAHPPYDSNPPTSGWHYDTPTTAGVYDQPIADETVVHNLEHGYVIISYNCSLLQGITCDDLKARLHQLFNVKRAWKIIIEPRPSLDTGIALTAWDVIDKFNTYDEARINHFIDQFRDQGPEKTQD